MKENYKVYIHITPNNKFYIGITKNSLKRRWNNGKGYKSCILFNRAIEKYGWENIKHKLLYDNLTKEEAEQKEIELIKKYKSNNEKYGYNIANGGSHIGCISETTKEKIRKSKKGKMMGKENPFYGKKHTENTKKILSENHKGLIPWTKGKHLSYEHKKNLSISKKGKHRKQEDIEKMREIFKGAKNPNSKQVIQYDKQGNFIKKWDYISQASNELNICRQDIGKNCLGKIKSAGGYIWKYANNNIK